MRDRAAISSSPAQTARSRPSRHAAIRSGVNQYTSRHVFEDLVRGGRIVLDRGDVADTAGIGTIRAHMRTIVADFQAGNFTKPFAVHGQVVPRTDIMTRLKDRITYAAIDRPNGAEVRITTPDPSAVTAVPRFLAFQRMEPPGRGTSTSNGTVCQFRACRTPALRRLRETGTACTLHQGDMSEESTRRRKRPSRQIHQDGRSHRYRPAPPRELQRMVRPIGTVARAAAKVAKAAGAAIAVALAKEVVSRVTNRKSRAKKAKRTK